MISNKYLHDYNMRNNPEYKSQQQDRAEGKIHRNYYRDQKYYGEDRDSFYQQDKPSDIDSDFKNDNQLNPVTRPMPTDFFNLKSTQPPSVGNYEPRKHLRQYDVTLGDNHVKDFYEEYRDKTTPIVSEDKSYLGNAYTKFRHYGNDRVLRNTQNYRHDRNAGNFRKDKNIDVHEELVNKNAFTNSGFGPSFTTEFFDSLDLHREEFKLNIKIFRILVWEKTVELRSRYGFS